MTPPVYDALMDHLAELAVTAVQQPDSALHSYWLRLAGAVPWQVSVTSQTIGDLMQRAVTMPLPAWAQPLAPGALGRLLHDGVWLQTAVDEWLPRRRQVRWDDLAPYRQATWHWQPIYAPYTAEIGAQASTIWQTACCLYGPHPSAWGPVPSDVLRGVLLFEAGLYFACHEYFETLWGRTGDAASDFYQGLIQVSVAMRHLESHNLRGAVTLLRYGIGRLKRYPSVYKGLDLMTIISHLEALLAALDSIPDPAAYQFDPSQVPHLVTPWSEGA